MSTIEDQHELAGPLLTEAEACSWLGVSADWLNQHEHELGAVRLGGSLVRWPLIGLVARACLVRNDA